MRKILQILPLLLSPFLTGCLSPRQQTEAAPVITNADSLNTDKLQLGLAKQREDLHGDIRDEVKQSQNAIQANVSSLLGASIGKIGEEVNAVKLNLTDLLRIQTELRAEFNTKIGEMNANLNASVASNNELRLTVQSQISMNTELKAKLEATLKVNAELQAKLDTVVAGQVGIGNKIQSSHEELRQDFKAGGDILNTQFTKEMLEALRSANHTTFYTNMLYAGILIGVLIAAVLVIGLIMRASRNRADNRANSMLKLVGRTMTMLDPTKVREISHELDKINTG